MVMLQLIRLLEMQSGNTGDIPPRDRMITKNRTSNLFLPKWKSCRNCLSQEIISFLNEIQILQLSQVSTESKEVMLQLSRPLEIESGNTSDIPDKYITFRMLHYCRFHKFTYCGKNPFTGNTTLPTLDHVINFKKDFTKVEISHIFLRVIHITNFLVLPKLHSLFENIMQFSFHAENVALMLLFAI